VIAIDNHSGFPVEVLSIPDLDGQEIPLLVSSQTWRHSNRSDWEPTEEPPPICFADEYFSEPSYYSSLKNEAQTATEKRYVDVLVNGSAYAPRGVPTQTATVELYAGTIAKLVRVVGDRFYASSGPSSPAEFLTMPLIYERAFGGYDPRRNEVWRQNPAGIGFRRAKSQSTNIATEYPNLEPIREPLEGAPAGFGIVSRSWSPRIEYAGTYDDNWLNNQWPLLPSDFDTRYYQTAPVDQQIDSLATGDPVRLVNFTVDGLWEFAMPSTTLETWLISDRGSRRVAPRMDTVMIEPDDRRITLVFRLNLARENQQDRIREIHIGPVTRAYLRARERRKRYLDFRLPKPTATEETS
jgi:hypothetical protein